MDTVKVLVLIQKVEYIFGNKSGIWLVVMAMDGWIGIGLNEWMDGLKGNGPTQRGPINKTTSIHHRFDGYLVGGRVGDRDHGMGQSGGDGDQKGRGRSPGNTIDGQSSVRRAEKRQGR
jgi:hypothetical protein